MSFFDRIKNKDIHQAYKDLFDLDNPTAKAVLRDMCKAHGVFDGGFDPDPYIHAMHGGERNAVLRILTIINAEPEVIIDLSKEVL